MKNLVWLLFFPGFLCNLNPLRINPDSLVTWNGSCVVIPCQINQYMGALLSNISLLWYHQPFYDTNQSDYLGHLLYYIFTISGMYGTQVQSSPASRLEFVGNLQDNLETKDCSLKISQVRMEDNGIYGVKLFASYNRPVQLNKWFLNATINVAESPPDPKMDLNPKDIQEGWIRVTCFVPYHCPAEPLRLTISGLEKTRLSSQETTISNGMIQTVVNLEMTWEDHGKSLVCSLEEQNGLEISKSTMQLYVKYAPKDVRVIASPGMTIRAGETLSLECTRSSSNPEVYQYLWYKDDQLMFEWLKLKKIEFETEGDQHSGAYRCEAKNSVGSEKSEELRIDVQYAPRDVWLIASPGTSIHEGERLSLKCMLKSSTPEVSEYLWYKDDQVMDEWKNFKKIEFEAETDQHSGIYRCEAKNSFGTQKSEELVIDVQSHLHYSSSLPTSGYQRTTESGGPQSSPASPSTTKSVSSCDGRTLWEEFSFLRELPNQAGKPRTQFIHSCKELTSAVIHLTEKFRKALLQIRERTRPVPNEIKKQ
ncbi:B-cell receptor CD22-like [Paroedura picta]|uniref:B-cell receptor CD22-like n=1 Tax=Paroedura picta TaxID=143630 RepID=UPI0040566DE9